MCVGTEMSQDAPTEQREPRGNESPRHCYLVGCGMARCLCQYANQVELEQPNHSCQWSPDDLSDFSCPPHPRRRGGQEMRRLLDSIPTV